MDYPNDSVIDPSATNPSAPSATGDVSYVSAYQPPTVAAPINAANDAPVTPNAWSAPAPSAQPISSNPAPSWSPAPEPNRSEPMAAAPTPSTDITPSTNEFVAAPAATQPPAASEELADQNIFEMLGVTDGTPEQREQFLTELQQVIWEDFIDHDVKLLLTESEYTEFQGVMQSVPDKSEEQQEKALEYLEKLIPDLEEIMLEKALQLKEEMVKERVRALRQLHAQDPAKLALLDQADAQMTDQLWRSATLTLASI